MAIYFSALVKSDSILIFLRSIVSLCLTFCFFVPIAQADEEATAEYKLKAALLYKLTRFVTWPEQEVKTSNFAICVLGENVFADALEPLRKREVKNHPIEIFYFSQSEDINQSCQLIFISDSKKAFIRQIIQRLNDEATLTLSDSSEFAANGGMIEFVQGERNIGFKINSAKAKQAGLSIAAPLLELAEIVGADDRKSLK
ncbi:hypothetical protein AI19_13645 [Thalassolituus oleivorans 4BN06-13]|nr:hypothetical protein [Thalassolituus oleivorans 4BN06-13]